MIYLVLFCKLLITNECRIVFGRQGTPRWKLRANRIDKCFSGHSSQNASRFGRRQIGRIADSDRDSARRAKRRVDVPFRVRIAQRRSESNLLTPTSYFLNYQLLNNPTELCCGYLNCRGLYQLPIAA